MSGKYGNPFTLLRSAQSCQTRHTLTLAFDFNAKRSSADLAHSHSLTLGVFKAR